MITSDVRWNSSLEGHYFRSDESTRNAAWSNDTLATSKTASSAILWPSLGGGVDTGYYSVTVCKLCLDVCSG